MYLFCAYYEVEIEIDIFIQKTAKKDCKKLLKYVNNIFTLSNINLQIIYHFDCKVFALVQYGCNFETSSKLYEELFCATVTWKILSFNI